MKKLPFLTIILMGLLTMAARAQENNVFHVRFSVVDATCYNNGKVVYALEDESGAVLDSLPQQLSQVRVYYKQSETDSAHYAGWYYAGGMDTMTVNYGSFIVGVEGLLADSAGGYVRVDTQALLTIATVYQKPRQLLSRLRRGSNGIRQARSLLFLARTSDGCSCAFFTASSLTR